MLAMVYSESLKRNVMLVQVKNLKEDGKGATILYFRTDISMAP
jgi:hypothetical protein